MTAWLITIKPSFLSEVTALPAKEAAQVQKKLSLLAEDPTPDAKVKKQLKYMGGKLHRLRSGDYRVFYTFEEPYVSVLALRRRDDDTYDGGVEPESLGGGAVGSGATSTTSADSWQQWLQRKPAAKSERYLPRKLGSEWLTSIHVPKHYHDNLVGIETEETLLECEAVPEDYRLQIIDALMSRPLEQIAEQPDLLLEDTEDLIRYREGDVLAFLLKLNPTQQKFVTWATDAKGPTLLKGGPGTGKSTVAIYRIREYLRVLRKAGVKEPRILFTTYTNALVRFSEQLLAALLKNDAKHVDVRTADSVAMQRARAAGLKPKLASFDELRAVLREAMKDAHQNRLQGNALSVAAQEKTLARLGDDYLAEEVLGVIEARGIETIDAYRDAARPGRKIALNKTQREAVWRVREALVALLDARGMHTWEQVRLAAAKSVESVDDDEQYDAVVVDEAQDLQPVALKLLVRLCRQPNRLFLTADANQSIYGGSFRWSDVHDSLQFRGRTGVLTANHRSTREVGEAAHSYLAGGVIDTEDGDRAYVNNGPLPAVRAVETPGDETKLIARFFRGATRQLRLGLRSCAVLCPTNAVAQRLAAGLQEEGLTARFMVPKELDLAAAGAKALTLKSAKGLEFPIVAMAGFLGSNYPYLPNQAVDEEQDEILARERRTMFVAMTRAMRALLVVVPTSPDSELLLGFDKAYWNMGEADVG